MRWTLTKRNEVVGRGKKIHALKFKWDIAFKEKNLFYKMLNPNKTELLLKLIKISEKDLNELREKAKLCEIAQESNLKLKAKVRLLEKSKDVLEDKLEALEKDIKTYSKDSEELENYKTILKIYPKINNQIEEDKTKLEYRKLKFKSSKDLFIKKLIN